MRRMSRDRTLAEGLLVAFALVALGTLVGEVNWILMVACVALVVGFRESGRLPPPTASRSPAR